MNGAYGIGLDSSSTYSCQDCGTTVGHAAAHGCEDCGTTCCRSCSIELAATTYCRWCATTVAPR
jgi:hypothetical protein